MGVGEPEVQRHGRRLGQEAQEQQGHRDDDQRIGAMSIERGADLGHVERAGSRVEHRDPDEHRVAGNAVGDRKVDRTLDRRPLLDPVGGQRERDGAHQLEEHDQVEQITGQAEAHHRRQEQQHQAVEQPLDRVEVPQRVGQRGEHHQRRERGHAAADRIDRQRDADRHAVARGPAAEPVGERLLRGVDRQQHAERRGGDRGGEREAVLKPAGQHRSGRHQERRHDERDDDRERGHVGHARLVHQCFCPSPEAPGGLPGGCCQTACALG
jgi:hypothetical protein